jgi:hypothetical protein
MTQLMVIGGGNLEARSAKIVMFCKSCWLLNCSMRGLSDPR